jgi:SAM-dependent methyltransferase
MSADPAPQFDWNGPNGDRWVENQSRLDRMLKPYGDALAAAAGPVRGERVLDVGCGAGATSFDFAGRVGPEGHVVGVDISEALIRRARDIARDQAPAVEFRLADAGAVMFEPVFDRIVSRFGVMFFDDPVAAFANLRAALKPGGAMTFVCWRGPQENDWTRLPMTAIRDIAPPLPPGNLEAPGPFAFADRDRVARILAEAAFTDIDIRPFDHPVLFGVGETPGAAVEDAVSNAIKVGPLERALADQPDDVRVQAIEAVRQAYAARLSAEGVVIEGAAWIVTARRG